MTDDTRKADVKNWRRGYEAALSGKAFVGDEKPSAWRLGYRDGRALRLKQHVETKQLDRSSTVPERVQKSAGIALTSV
jgi:hypothetical protein